MRLTADVILHARASINPCDERELDLRGYKIPMIENLGVTQDQFDAMDFSDNEIKKLDNFPRYKRLSSLLLCNNHVSRIAADLGGQLPKLSCLILTNNKLSTLGDLEGLGTCKNLTMLSLLHNEVVNKQYYRLYTINLVPSLKQLDFQKVTVKERESAARLAKSQAGQVMLQDVAKEAEKAKTFTPGGANAGEQKLTDEHRAIYAERIAKATTVEEIEMLSKKIQAGIIPSATYKQGGGVAVANGTAPAAPAVPATEDIEESKKDTSSVNQVDKVSSATATPAAPSAVAVAVEAAAEAAAPSGEQENDAEELQDAPSATPAVVQEALPTAQSSSTMDVEAEEGGEGGGDGVQETAGGEGEGEGEASSTGIVSDGDGGGEDGARREEEEEEVAEEMAVDGEEGQKGGEGQDGAPPAATAEDEQEEGSGDMDQEGEAEAEADGVAEEAKLSEATIKKFKVADLKGELMSLDLPTHGLKADLQARLLEAMGY